VWLFAYYSPEEVPDFLIRHLIVDILVNRGEFLLPSDNL